jgi:hypothetical protein
MFGVELNYVFARGTNECCEPTNWSSSVIVRNYNGIFLGTWNENYYNLNLSILPFVQTNITNLSLTVTSVGSRKESNITTANMTMHYAFDELSPTAQLVEEVGGLNANVYPSAGLAGGYNTRARNFTNSYANSTGHIINYTNNMTIILVYRPTQNTSYSASYGRAFTISSRDDLSAQFSVNGWGDGRLFFKVINSTLDEFDGVVGTLYNTNTYHVVGTVGNNRIKTYLNGVLISNTSFVGTISGGGSKIYFGNDYTLTAGGNGTIDDYREYSNEWNATQVLNDYNILRNNSVNTPTNRSDIKLWLPFDGDAIDYSPYNIQNTSINNPTFTTSGKYNGGVIGNRTNYPRIEYVLQDMQNPTMQQSVRAWVKFDNNSQRSIFMGLGATTENAWYVQMAADGHLGTVLYNATGTLFLLNDTTQRIELGKWYYVRIDSNETMQRLVVNNIVVNQTSFVGGMRVGTGYTFKTIGRNLQTNSGDFVLDDVLYLTHCMSDEEGQNDYLTSIGTRLNSTVNNDTSNYLWDSLLLIPNGSIFSPKNITNISWGYALNRSGISVDNTSNILFNVTASIEQLSNISKGTEIINSTSYNVNITHIAEREYSNGTIKAGIDNSTVLNSLIDDSLVLVSNNLNSSIRYLNREFLITTGHLNLSDNFYYNVSLQYSDAPIVFYIPPTPVSCYSTNGTSNIHVYCSAGSGNITNGMNFTNLNTNTWINGSALNANFEALNSATLYNFRVYAWNSSGTGRLSLSYSSISNTTQTIPGIILYPNPIINITHTNSTTWINWTWEKNNS